MTARSWSPEARTSADRWGPDRESGFFDPHAVELLDRQSWRTRVELANAIFEYLEIFHNRQRRHSALGMLSPIEFETRHQTKTVA